MNPHLGMRIKAEMPNSPFGMRYCSSTAAEEMYVKEKRYCCRYGSSAKEDAVVRVFSLSGLSVSPACLAGS